MWTGRKSVYREKFEDEMGIFFTPENFPELMENREDVSDILQGAIKRLVEEQCYGNLYIPEGEYPIAKNVKIPPSVRLIGYGEKRPVFYIPESAPFFDGDSEAVGSEFYFKGYPGANYMLWFIGDRDMDKEDTRDANAGTFYSALSNIDFRIDGNHPMAVCIRAHFAQHGFINHCHFDLGTGLAAIYDVGNEMEDLTVEGGKYGLICRMTSPGWPFVLLDSVFKGQRDTAILTTTTGFTGFRLRISDTPKAFDLYVKETWEKLYLEDCIFANISDTVITSYESKNVVQQTNLKNVLCVDCPTLINRADERVKLNLNCNTVIDKYIAGYMCSDIAENALFKEEKQFRAFKGDRAVADSINLRSDIPELPDMSKWVSVKKYGAVGDGKTDDTEALRKAFASEEVLFLPQGIYKVSDTVTLGANTCLIGLSPITTQIVIEDDEEAFEGFGIPRPVVDTLKGSHVIINGIGIDTAGKNPQACGLRWRAGEGSYLNDVKFMGGHGIMFRDGRNPFAQIYNPTRTGDFDPDRVWDFQYSSLWITEGGGGTFKDIWSASPYAEAGIAITNTSTRSRMYQISLEHHVRHEIKLHNVANFNIYGLQTEEEKAEGLECLPMEIVGCRNIEVVNYYLFRVVSVYKSFDQGIMVWDSSNIVFRNVQNKAQMQYTFTKTLEDKNTGFVAKSSDYAYLAITGKRAPKALAKEATGFTKIA
ncbi:MAG: hypothetical protein J6033_00170, partial [Lachnospiraceae bacterium]|nr:hypothetical protein [Lachnospiraceae bacterium]